MKYLAAWLSQELKKWDTSLRVGKLNGENSAKEKERVSRLFKEGYVAKLSTSLNLVGDGHGPTILPT